MKRTKTYFELWANNESTMTKLITFLLGFYVAMIAKRWWDQIGKLPDAVNFCLVLGGLVWSKDKPGPTSAQASLQFKKTVIRYLLLSWTMCLSGISTPLKEKFATVDHYIEKKLITKIEADALKMTSRDCINKWWVPLSWITSMINDAFNNTGLIPKDHKDVVNSVCKFRFELHSVAEYRLKPLPSIYKQAVWAAVCGWMLMGVVANQNTVHHREEGVTLSMIIYFSFPFHGLLMYMLVIAWLKIADILSNPFGNDKHDVNLASILELNIWKASTLLENQENAFHSKFLKYPYHQLEERTGCDNLQEKSQFNFESEHCVMSI